MICFAHISTCLNFENKRKENDPKKGEKKNMTFAIRGCFPNFNLRADAFINFMLLSFLHQYIVNNLSLKNVLKDIGKR